jgi:hypothetical protein
MEYPFTEIVNYTDDIGYRNTLRTLLKMEKQFPEKIDDFDISDLDLDKDDFDEISSAIMLDHIFETTSNNPVFQEIYKHTAGLMFTEDINVGIVVLLSYDYLPDFHNCLCQFFKEGVILEEDILIITLKQKIGYNEG